MAQFEAKYDEFRAMGAEVVGISVDSHFSNVAFAQHQKLRFPLLSDFNREVVEAFAGYFPEVAGYFKVNQRRILVLDPASIVRWAWTATSPAEIPDTEMVREAVQEVAYE